MNEMQTVAATAQAQAEAHKAQGGGDLVMVFELIARMAQVVDELASALLRHQLDASAPCNNKAKRAPAKKKVSARKKR